VQELDLAPAELAAPPAVRLLRLWHGGLPWAVAEDRVCEVAGFERLQRHPRPAAGSPYGWLLGEREEIPVFLLAGIGLASGAGAVIVLQPETGPRRGLCVDAVDEAREEPISRLRLPPAPAAAWCAAFPRLVLWDDGLALEIAAAGIAMPAAGEPRLDAALVRPTSSAGLFTFALPGRGGIAFALPATQVVEALSSITPRPVPGAPAPLLGLLAWRGEALPVLDLAHAVGLPPTPSGGSGIAHGLVARAARSRQLLVFPVAGMGGVRQGPFSQAATTLPPFPGARRVLGAFADGKQALVVPDLDGLLQTFTAERAAAGAATAGR
jgi:chemotaxis signal transduction protein